MAENDTNNLVEIVGKRATLEEVRQFIDNAGDRNACVTSTDGHGFTALHWAALHNRFDIACLLIENADDKAKYVEALDYGKQTALHYAAGKEGSLPLMRELLKHLISEDDTASSPSSNYSRLADYTNASTSHNDTPLHVAVHAGQGHNAFFLLEHDADPAIEDFLGENGMGFGIKLSKRDMGSHCCLSPKRETGRQKIDQLLYQLARGMGLFYGCTKYATLRYRFPYAQSSYERLRTNRSINRIPYIHPRPSLPGIS
ncbi:ankyrin repeat-containing domain protein [Hypoxylon sp. FL1284]|nr:ankyrin repeat-containing domain protein [Hypoxylon sp. FL1284]